MEGSREIAHKAFVLRALVACTSLVSGVTVVPRDGAQVAIGWQGSETPRRGHCETTRSNASPANRMYNNIMI